MSLLDPPPPVTNYYLDLKSIPEEWLEAVGSIQSQTTVEFYGAKIEYGLNVSPIDALQHFGEKLKIPSIALDNDVVNWLAENVKVQAGDILKWDAQGRMTDGYSLGAEFGPAQIITTEDGHEVSIKPLKAIKITQKSSGEADVSLTIPINAGMNVSISDIGGTTELGGTVDGFGFSLSSSVSSVGSSLKETHNPGEALITESTTAVQIGSDSTGAAVYAKFSLQFAERSLLENIDGAEAVSRHQNPELEKVLDSLNALAELEESLTGFGAFLSGNVDVRSDYVNTLLADYYYSNSLSELSFEDAASSLNTALINGQTLAEYRSSRGLPDLGEFSSSLLGVTYDGNDFSAYTEDDYYRDLTQNPNIVQTFENYYDESGVLIANFELLSGDLVRSLLAEGPSNRFPVVIQNLSTEFDNSGDINLGDLSFGFVDADSDGAYVFGASPGSIGAIESLGDGQRVVVALSGDVLNLELSSSNQGFILIETALGKQVIYIEEMTGASFELELPGGNVITVQRDDLFDSSKEGSPILRSDAYAQENSVADRVFVNTQDRIFFETPEFNGPRDYVSIGAADWLNLPRDFVDGNLDNYQLAPIELFDSYSLGSGLDFTGLLDLGENAYFSERSAQSSLGKDYFWVRPTDSLALGSMQGLGDFSLSNLSGRADLTVRVADPALDVWTLFEQSSFVQDQSASIGSLSLQGLTGEDLGSLEFQLGDNIQLLQLRFGDDIALDPETFGVLQNDDGTFTTVMQEGAELTVSSGETVLAQDLIDHTKQEATNVADFLFQELSSVFSKLQDVIFGSEFEQLQGEILGRLLLGESLDEIVEAIGSELAENLVEELVAVPLLNTLNIDPQSFAHGVAKASVAGFAVNVLQGEENLGEAAGDAVVTAAVTRALAKVNYGLNEGASSGIGDSGNSGLGESGNAAIAAAVTTLVLSLSKGGLGSENLEHSYKAAVSAAASQYVAHLVAVSLTPLFGPLGYAVGYAVGQALGDVVGVPVYNYVGNKLDAGKEVYDAFEDLLTGKDGFGQFAKDFGKALDDLLINAPKEFIQDLGKGIIDKFLGGYSKQSSTNTVASRTEVIAGGNSRIIGVRAEGALLQASQSGDDEILGTNGADVIVGRDGANVAAGFGGDDKVINLWLNFQQDVVFLKAA